MAESVAAMLLDAAREDAKAVRALSQLPEISDTIVGFHAQQSIEKALKAVLSSSSVAFRRTHDIAELLDLISDHRLPSPPFADFLDELNPFAVEARYGLIAPGSIDRLQALEWIDQVLDWAGATSSGHRSEATARTLREKSRKPD